MKTIMLLIAFCLAVISCLGCASIPPPQGTISETFQTDIGEGVLVPPIIDSRPAKGGTMDIADLSMGKSIHENVVYWTNSKGYVTKEYAIDVKGCGSLKGVLDGAEITCLTYAGYTPGDMILLISIDDYVPPKATSMTAMVGITGLLYNPTTNKILWKNSYRFASSNDLLLMYGIGGYLGGLLAQAMMSADRVYEIAAFPAVDSLIRTLPDCPEDKRGTPSK